MNTHTEKEAAGKLCPERIKHAHDVMRTVGLASYPDRCIGSACMWWQWVSRPEETPHTGFCGAIWRYR